MHQVGVHEKRRAGRTGQRDDTAVVDQLLEQTSSDDDLAGPGRIRIGHVSLDESAALRLRHDHHRRIARVDLVQEDADHDRPRLSHRLHEVPGRVILMPRIAAMRSPLDS